MKISLLKYSNSQKKAIVIFSGLSFLLASWILNPKLFFQHATTAFTGILLFFLLLGISGLLILSIHFLVRAKWSEFLVSPSIELLRNIKWLSFAVLLLIPLFFMGTVTETSQIQWSSVMFKSSRLIFFSFLLLVFSFAFSTHGMSETKLSGLRRISFIFIILLIPALIFFGDDMMTHYYPGFHSTVFPFWLIASGLQAGIARLLIRERKNKISLTSAKQNDLARYLLAMSSVTAYLFFSQFIIILYGARPEELSFLEKQMNPMRGIPFIAAFTLSYLIPVILLLFRNIRLQSKACVLTGLAILSGKFIEFNLLFLYSPFIRHLSYYSALIGIFIIFHHLFRTRPNQMHP